jgi:hypothetical protein
MNKLDVLVRKGDISTRLVYVSACGGEISLFQDKRVVIYPAF